MLRVLGTGGTIAGRAACADDVVGYQAGVVAVQDLLQGLPAPPGWTLQTAQVANLDSKDMTVAVWRALLQAVHAALHDPAVGAVLVTHGTDTLEETAWLLQAALAPAKPVVLTGAMRPATARVPDGPQNLTDAVTLATDAALRAAGGVWVTLAGRVFDAAAARKVHPARVDAFGGGDAGPAAWVEGGRVRWLLDPAARVAALEALAGSRGAAVEPPWQAAAWPRVEWITSHAAADGALVRALLAQRCAARAGQDADAPLAGLVVAGTGNGSVHAELADALRQAQQEGVAVWVTTRCAEGEVLPSPHGRSAGGWAVTPLPPAKARISLMLALLAQADPR
ncbi:putative L-asparaginase [Tepidimonas alkaliphilus]|uniref:Putative L-asparaginase n=1 Tax=Tepidimonas alkaliphilus TaxID=2588942 RepID=A0A554W8S0_9BURK|nr:putative L-asparaginase [Tepidimonas alkaliphilus]